MTRRTRFSLRETMAQCHDLHPRVARTNGSGIREISRRRCPGCARAVPCRTGRGRCRRSGAAIPARSTCAPAAAERSLRPRLISSHGDRKPDTASRSESTAGGTGIRGASNDSDEGGCRNPSPDRTRPPVVSDDAVTERNAETAKGPANGSLRHIHVRSVRSRRPR